MRYFVLLLIFPCFLTFGQDSIHVISGKVIDDFTLEPLVGANILVLGTIKGVVTDINGEFTLSFPKDKNEIKVSYVGYEAKDFFIIQDCSVHSSNHKINFKLKQSSIHMSGAYPIRSFDQDSIEFQGRIDALSQIKKGKMILLQADPITDIQNIFENKYDIIFSIDKINSAYYRIAFNQTVLAELIHKYGFIFLDELEVISWINH
jgi:hypothetical protein